MLNLLDLFPPLTMSSSDTKSSHGFDHAGRVTTIRDRLEGALDDLDVGDTGSFAFKCTYTDAPNPTLRLTGPGRVGLPLGEKQAQDVIACCEPAPFGMGERTVVDKDVRNTWEMDAAKVAFDHPAWDAFISRVVTNVCEALGVSEMLSRPRCELYKLLACEKGSNFLPHVDTEKASNVFATVVITLPTEFTGGDVHVSRCGRSMVLNTSQGSLANTTVLAWYADVLHEVKPITSGVRLALTYNLIHTTAIKPFLLDYLEEMKQLREILCEWNSKRSSDAGVPDRIVFRLEHNYPRANLSARALKGPDARTVAVLDEAARCIGLGMALANFRHVMCGLADQHGYYSARGGLDSLTFADGADMDYSSYIENLVDLEGRLLHAKEMDFEEKENTIPFRFVRQLRDEEGDEQKYDGDDTLERVYRMSVLVVWPTWSKLARLGGDRRAVECSERLAVLENTEPASEDEAAFAYVLQSTGDDPSTLFGIARRWKRADLWRSVLLKFGHEDCTKEIIAGAETLGFDTLKPTIQEFLRMLPSNAARFRPIEALRAWAAGATPAIQAAVSAFAQEEIPWLLEHLQPPVKQEVQLVTNEALEFGGVHAVETLLVPRIVALDDLGFMQHYATFLACDTSNTITDPEQRTALARAVDTLLSEIAARADFFPIPKPHFHYTVKPRPPNSHQPAFAFLKACLDQGRTLIAARAIQRMLDVVAGCAAKLATSRALAVLLPLIPSLSTYFKASSMSLAELPLDPSPSTYFKTSSISLAELPLDELGKTTIELVVKSDEARKGKLTAVDVSALLEATTFGDTYQLFSLLMQSLEALPWRESFSRICIETVRTRRGQLAFSNIPPTHYDLVLEGMAAKFARQVNYSSCDSAQLRALFNFCTDVGGVNCLGIILDRAVEPTRLEPNYVDRTLFQMITPLCLVARNRWLPLGSEPFARILCTIMRTWVDKCLGPRPDEARIQTLLSGLAQYRCACADCTPVRKFLNNNEAPPTGWDADGCYLHQIGENRYNHVEYELTRWASQLAIWESCRSGTNGIRGIRVHFSEVLLSHMRWKEMRTRGIQALQNIGNESELTTIFGSFYPTLADALRTSE